MFVRYSFYLALRLQCVVAIPLSSLGARDEQVLEVQLSASISKGPSQQIDHTFPAFAFEGATFFEYAGPKGQPNEFAQNLIDEIATGTGSAPMIRVGGTSLDRAPFDPSQKQPLIIPGDTGKGIPEKMTVGPSYFDSFANFPSAQYIVMVPFALAQKDQSIQFAKSAIGTVSRDKISVFEIGNEPDLYVVQQRRPQGWGPQDYANQFTEYAKAIFSTRDVNFSKLEAGALSNGQSDEWDLKNIFVPPLKGYSDHIQTVSDHFYQTTADGNTNFQTSHKAIISHMSTFRASLSYLRSNYPSISFVLGEVGMILRHAGFNTTQTTTLGGALWQADFMLYSMSLGIRRVNMQILRGGTSLFQAIQIGSTPPQVFSTFYAQVFAVDFIGTNPKVQVQNIDLNREFLSAYAAYDDGKLARAAFVNLKSWAPQTDGPNRPEQTVQFHVPNNSVKKLKVKTLTSPFGFTDGAADMTWAGMKWDHDHQPPGKGYVVGEQFRTVSVDETGAVKVEVGNSEAVMVFF